MSGLSHHEVITMLLALATLLGAARVLGGLAQSLRQPRVLGELLAGVFLGPTILGTLQPEWQAALFPSTGHNALALDAISKLAILLFLLVAGMEVDLSIVWRQGKVALKVGALGTLVPFIVGLIAAHLAPELLGRESYADSHIFALFLATALSISALPVIAKTLMDLDLYRTDFGMVVISAAVLGDLFGWLVFGVILGLVGPGVHAEGIALTIIMTLGFAALMLTLGRWAIHKLLPYIQAYTRWPDGIVTFCLVLALLSGAATEAIGIHAIFGAFLAGVAVGDSPHLREKTRALLEQIVGILFAPIFFAGIGLKVNFWLEFQWPIVLAVLLLACVVKLAGATWGARWGGMPRNEAWAVGFAMNARGAMEIVLGLLALQAGLIGKPLFVALVVMALVTSSMSGAGISLLLKRRRPARVNESLHAKVFARKLAGSTRREAIHELAALASQHINLSGEAIEQAAWNREETLPTGIGHGVAIPHARLAGLKEPLVAVGISEGGIDFDAPDGLLAQVIFLTITPAEDPQAQLELSSQISSAFRKPEMLKRVLRTASFTEFLAAMSTPE